MPKPVKHITTETKALLDERLLKLNTTGKRMSWEEIKRNVRGKVKDRSGLNLERD